MGLYGLFRTDSDIPIFIIIRLDIPISAALTCLKSMPGLGILQFCCPLVRNNLKWSLVRPDLDIPISRLDIPISRLNISISRLNIHISRLDMTIRRLDILISRLDIPIRRLI